MKIRKYENLNHKATIKMSGDIYASIVSAVQRQDKEFAWFGDVVVEQDDPENFVIRISDIYLYPQTVSNSSVSEPDTSSQEYLDFMCDKIAEGARLGKPVMQYYGHSHVNMGVTPSAVDMDYRNQNAQLNVFSIHNKAGNMEWQIWTEDFIYETKDIDVQVMGTKLQNTELIKEKAYPKVMHYGGAYPNYNRPYAAPGKPAGSETKTIHAGDYGFGGVESDDGWEQWQALEEAWIENERAHLEKQGLTPDEIDEIFGLDQFPPATAGKHKEKKGTSIGKAVRKGKRRR